MGRGHRRAAAARQRRRGAVSETGRGEAGGCGGCAGVAWVRHRRAWPERELRRSATAIGRGKGRRRSRLTGRLQGTGSGGRGGDGVGASAAGRQSGRDGLARWPRRQPAGSSPQAPIRSRRGRSEACDGAAPATSSGERGRGRGRRGDSRRRPWGQPQSDLVRGERERRGVGGGG